MFTAQDICSRYSFLPTPSNSFVVQYIPSSRRIVAPCKLYGLYDLLCSAVSHVELGKIMTPQYTTISNSGTLPLVVLIKTLRFGSYTLFLFSATTVAPDGFC